MTPHMTDPDDALNAVEAGSRAIVVFTDDTDMKVLRCLKPGFRHCYLAIEAGRYWVLVDPSSHGTSLTVFQCLAFQDIVSWFMAFGSTVVCCRASGRIPGKRLLRPLTCVESVKRILGLDVPLVLTPWQLFRHLSR